MSLALHGTHLFNFVQDGEMNMTLQDPILLGTYDVSEEGILEFSAEPDEFQDWRATIHLVYLDVDVAVFMRRSVALGGGGVGVRLLRKDAQVIYESNLVPFGNLAVGSKIGSPSENAKENRCFELQGEGNIVRRSNPSIGQHRRQIYWNHNQTNVTLFHSRVPARCQIYGACL